MHLRLELFVDDVPRSLAFYVDVLGFAVAAEGEGDYVQLHRGAAVLSLNRREGLPDDHPVQAAPGIPLGKGIEIVLQVDDIVRLHESVRASGWPLAAPLMRRPWDCADFRLVDPDGYYLRLTD
ncbi:hypothetical protein SAMN02745157_0644 [Kaistia soli DSM 19436]|uniref:VOC domain-containing protein n=2 Tax=Kaistia TaxID=166953 RepID=A0A1M4V9B9_9HYPH|nr:hypothetical protein SAMN02745157_0644 [Kaistia soli DSM 19436]